VAQRLVRGGLISSSQSPWMRVFRSRAQLRESFESGLTNSGGEHRRVRYFQNAVVGLNRDVCKTNAQHFAVQNSQNPRAHANTVTHHEGSSDQQHNGREDVTRLCWAAMPSMTPASPAPMSRCCSETPRTANMAKRSTR